MKMKRTLSLLLALVLSLSLLAGCGGGNSDQPAQDPPPQQGGVGQVYFLPSESLARRCASWAIKPHNLSSESFLSTR